MFINECHYLHQNAKRASTAAAPLAAWVRANIKYSHIVEKIQPLEKEQATLQKWADINLAEFHKMTFL